MGLTIGDIIERARIALQFQRVRRLGLIELVGQVPRGRPANDTGRRPVLALAGAPIDEVKHGEDDALAVEGPRPEALAKLRRGEELIESGEASSRSRRASPPGCRMMPAKKSRRPASCGMRSRQNWKPQAGGAGVGSAARMPRGVLA